MVRVIRVPKQDAESVRNELVSNGLLDKAHRIGSDGDHVLIPIIADGYGTYEIEDSELDEIDSKESDYRKLVSEDPVVQDSLPSSFDVIGDVVVIRIPEGLVGLSAAIGNAILKTNSSVRAVMADHGVKGELRIRELELIAGEGTSETQHKEFGVRMMTDPSKVYFNPRLATERMRIASQVKDGETIIDMFAGVAPFPLVISKHAKPEVIYSIDLNPEAKDFMERNIVLNKTKNIVPIQRDARSILRELPKADRIIMNLPQSAIEFLSDALRSVKDGGVIHLHRIMERDADTNDIIEIACKEGFEIEIKEKIELKTYSPTMSVFVFDVIRISSKDRE